MMRAGMLIVSFLAVPAALGSSDHHGKNHENNSHTIKLTAKPTAAKESGAVLAMDAEHARGIRSGELVTAGTTPMLLVARDNLKAELSPRSVAEFTEEGGFRLLRGSAVLESGVEGSARTPGARLEFVGRSLVSYDHTEKSTSVFVLEGEARLVNPHREDSTLRLARFRGATLVVGDVLPQLVRQLDVGGVKSWLTGFSWPAARVKTLLAGVPGEAVAAAEEPNQQSHLQNARIEDYFSSIDTADELHQPDYYERKFDDPDKVVAEANSMHGAGKALSPEEAALISLPKTQIDLGFELGPEFLTPEQKAKEVRAVEPKSVARKPASVAVKAAKPKAVKRVISEQGDPDVGLVLQRLRNVRSDNPVFSQGTTPARGPASVRETAVPDPVYDYSQNF